jgi:hypothetical protein
MTHGTDGQRRAALLLTHGAGGNANAPLLIAVASELARFGIVVRRYNLPFRQARTSGPPRPADAERDRAGLREALTALRRDFPGPVFAGGHSYGGRQASMLAAEDPGVCDGLLLQSYPLHPPGKPNQLRTAHLPSITKPVLFAHGTRDPFGSIEELRRAMALIRARTELYIVEGAGHDLKRGRDLGFCERFAQLAAPLT